MEKYIILPQTADVNFDQSSSIVYGVLFCRIPGMLMSDGYFHIFLTK